MAVCSTSNERAVSTIVRVLLGPEVEAKMQVFAGDIVKTKKPSPDIYDLAAKTLDVNPSRYLQHLPRLEALPFRMSQDQADFDARFLPAAAYIKLDPMSSNAQLKWCVRLFSVPPTEWWFNFVIPLFAAGAW